MLIQSRRIFFSLTIGACMVGCSNQVEVDTVAAVASVPTKEVEEVAMVEKVSMENPDEQGSSESDQGSVEGEYNELNEYEAYVILQKGTEPRSQGGYTMTKDPGTYICRQCNAQLYRAEHKFESHCGWPSFDDEIEGAVDRHLDADGRRIEIVCANCQGHLGHVFEGERLTPKNVRHCVNSISMKFIPKGDPIPSKIVATKSPKSSD